MKTKKNLQEMADGMLDDSIRHRVKEAARRKNAKQFFNNLILSLTKRKRKWTPTERMQFNRVAAFLDA